MLNTQQELDLKHFYQQRLNQNPIQKTSFNWSLTLIKSLMNRWLHLCLIGGFFASAHTTVFGQSCAILTAGSDKFFAQPQWKEIYDPLIKGCAGNGASLDAEFSRTMPTDFSNFVFFNVYKNNFSNCGKPIDYIKEEYVNNWRGMYKSLKESTYDGGKLFGRPNTGEKFSEQCRSVIVANLEKIFGTGSSTSPNARTSSNTSNSNVGNKSTTVQQRQGSDQSQQNQAAQQQSQQAQQLAQQNQARADQARQGKRKTHDPAAEAHECISIDNAGSGNFGAFKNSCGYKVNFSTCNYKPRIRQGGFNWSADFDCEKGQYGLHTPSAGVSVAAHNRNTEMVYWFACKHPANPVDTEFTAGGGVRGRCN
jgi:hypothetical protein